MVIIFIEMEDEMNPKYCLNVFRDNKLVAEFYHNSGRSKKICKETAARINKTNPGKYSFSYSPIWRIK
jgi:hypothetical protein